MHGGHRFWLVVLAITAGLLVNLMLGVVIIQQNHNTNSQRRLCDTLVQIIQKQDASLGQFSYYQHHPAELARAHAQTQDTIKTLDCGGL